MVSGMTYDVQGVQLRLSTAIDAIASVTPNKVLRTEIELCQYPLGSATQRPYRLIGLPYRLGAVPEKHGAADCLSPAMAVQAWHG